MTEPKKYVMTKEGREELERELKDLMVKLNETGEKIKVARAQGDLSENAEYDAAKDEQGKINAQIQNLKEIIDNAEIVDEEDMDPDVANIGKTVKVLDFSDDSEKEYEIVSVPQVNIFENKISMDSPLGVALTGAKVGEHVKVEAPAGVFEYQILEIYKKSRTED